MSKADKMFEKLGYKKEVMITGEIRYCKDDDNLIMFNPNDRSFYKSVKDCDLCSDITVKELQAINEKVKELGWNE